MRFAKLIQDLGLSKTDVEEILSIPGTQYEQWLRDEAPQSVLQQLHNLNILLEQLVKAWVDYVDQYLKLSPKEAQVGVPLYRTASDFHACDQEMMHALIFLCVYNQAFNNKLITALAQIGIKAKLVEIEFDDYDVWLQENDFENCPSSRIAYASFKLNANKRRKF